jgi:hypothetical protein
MHVPSNPMVHDGGGGGAGGAVVGGGAGAAGAGAGPGDDGAAGAEPPAGAGAGALAGAEAEDPDGVDVPPFAPPPLAAGACAAATPAAGAAPGVVARSRGASFTDATGIAFTRGPDDGLFACPAVGVPSAVRAARPPSGARETSLARSP